MTTENISSGAIFQSKWFTIICKSEKKNPTYAINDTNGQIKVANSLDVSTLILLNLKHTNVYFFLFEYININSTESVQTAKSVSLIHHKAQNQFPHLRKMKTGYY